MQNEFEELCRRYEVNGAKVVELVTKLLERLSAAAETLAEVLSEICAMTVDTEDAAEETPKTMCRDILCTRPHLIRIDRIPWYTSGFQ